MTTSNLVTVRVYGKPIKASTADPEDAEAGIVVLLSGLGIAGEDAARFAQSAATIVNSFEYELCSECLGDLDAHEIEIRVHVGEIVVRRSPHLGHDMDCGGIRHGFSALRQARSLIVKMGSLLMRTWGRSIRQAPMPATPFMKLPVA